MCTLAPPSSLLPTPTSSSSSSSKKKETLSFLPSFSAQFLLFEGGEMLCSAVFVSVVRQKKALCVPSFTASHARKGKGAFFIWHLFPTCSIGWEMHSKNKRRLRTHPPPFPCCPPLPGFNHPVSPPQPSFFFSRAPSQYGNFIFEAFWPSAACGDNYSSMALMQLVICHKNRANLFAARTHRLHDKGSQECFSTDLLWSILSGVGSRW